ncbi:MAG TPA: phage holin family protein [Thermoanaerobaculia bacterium]|nr:phage holin family protein [Thermoanaerobaculia bacterium]
MTRSTNEEKSLGTLFRDLAEDLSTLVRSEIALAKLEIKQAFTSLGTAGALLAAALFCALFGLVFLLVTALLVLALFMPAWLAALIAALVLFAGAGALAWGGNRKLRAAQLIPVTVIENVKKDVQTIKDELGKRSREHEG